MRDKTFVEGVLLFGVVLGHIAAFAIIWFAPNFALATLRQDLTLIIAPVTAAYFLAGIRFSIATQSQARSTKVRWTYVAVVLIVTTSFLGGVVGTLYAAGWHVPMAPEALKVFVGSIETFLGAGFALIAEDIFRQKIEKA